jgi:hypothetical protein
MSMSMSMSMSQSTGGLQHALTAASGLHAEAALLEPSIRAVYVREITEAGALFAYTDPDNSPVGGFLQQERRIALAEQVNRAILSTCLLSSFPHPSFHMPKTLPCFPFHLVFRYDLPVLPPHLGSNDQART